MSSIEFRNELTKIMPGYDWKIHRTITPDTYQSATGKQSSGYNRLSTLMVIRTVENGDVSYEVKSADYGTRSPWEHVTHGRTLARALRNLQQHYEHQARKFAAMASRLQDGRKPALEETK